MTVKIKFFPFFITSIKIFLGFVFFGGGMSKLYEGNFVGLMGPVWLEEELAKYGLGFYARFIAYSQVVIGLLMMTLRFSTLGAVMMIPMILNILMVTISLNWRGTPFVVSFFLLLNIIVLVADYHKLKFLLFDQVEDLKSQPLQRKSWKSDLIWGIGFICMIISPIFYKINAIIAYSLAFLGLILFFICPFFGRKT